MAPSQPRSDLPVLRPAGEKDAEAIAILWHRAWPDGHRGLVPDALLAHRRLPDFRKWARQQVSATTVATDGGRLVGFVTVRNNEVEQVYVALEARGGATARTLLAHAEGLIARHYESAWLAVVPGNTRARRFYERQGWRDAGGIEYAAHVAGGTVAVPCRRYEKQLASTGRCGDAPRETARDPAH